jgi:hypothetical protein
MMCWLSRFLGVGVKSFPEPPQSGVSILGGEVFNLLLPYGLTPLSAGDYSYLLMTKDEANRFMSWYKRNAPIKPGDYVPDDLDCDDFAWIMRAYALMWSKGRYLWGYTESEGADPKYPFPNHGFCFVVLNDKTVWYADALKVAAPDDEIMEAYPVKSYYVKC